MRPTTSKMQRDSVPVVDRSWISKRYNEPGAKQFASYNHHMILNWTQAASWSLLLIILLGAARILSVYSRYHDTISFVHCVKCVHIVSPHVTLFTRYAYIEQNLTKCVSLFGEEWVRKATHTFKEMTMAEWIVIWPYRLEAIWPTNIHTMVVIDKKSAYFWHQCSPRQNIFVITQNLYAVLFG